MRKILSLLLLSAFVAGWVPAAAQTAADAEQIVKNVYDKMGSGTWAVSNARTYMNSELSDGSWSDINYADPTMASWDAMKHWDRLDYMTQAYAGTGSSLRGNTTLYDKIVAAYNYWIKRNPIASNWYHNWIAWPTTAGRTMCYMRHAPKQLPDSTEQKLCNLIQLECGTPDSNNGERGTGANKMWVAMQWVLRSALQANLDNLNFALEQFFIPIEIVSDTTVARTGMQADLGFLQHGAQLYITGYGTTVMDAATMFDYIAGTAYRSLYADRLDLLSRFFRQSLLPAVRGGYYSFNPRGRGLAGPNSLNAWAVNSYTTPMARLDTAYATVYNRARTRINGQNSPSFGVTPYNRNFWNCDYMLHQRPGYTMDVRMVSTRTYRCESGNGENMRGYFIGDGGTWLSQSGTEYEGTFAMWEWSYVPGTTTPALANSAVPTPGAFLEAGTGETNFAGGVSDSTYGAAAFHQLDTDHGIATQANKAWFFFDNEVVCMGSGIRSENNNAIHTTLEQCKLSSTPSVENADGSTASLTTGAYSIDNPRWLLHGTTAYYLPRGGRLHVSNATQSGKWSDISTWRTDTATHGQTMFRAWLDHGTKPVGESYIYTILPAVSSISAAKQALDSLEFVNNDTVQAVYNHTLQTLQAVFHQAGIVRFGDGVQVSAEQPCMAMFRHTDSDEVPAYVADPTHTLGAVRLYAKFPALHAKQLDVTLPRGVNSGRTVALVVNAATADSIFTPLTHFELAERQITLDAGTPAVKVTVNAAPADATPQQYAWTTSNDSVVAVTPDGSVIALAGGEAVVRVSTLEGFTDSVRVIVNSTLRAFSPVADAYVSSASTGTNYGSSDNLLVRKSNNAAQYESYLRFSLNDVRSYVTDTAGVRVFLTLSLLATDAAVTDVAWNVFPVSSLRWSEKGITWGNKAKATTTNLLTQVAGRDYDSQNGATNVVAFDVSNYVLGQIAAKKTGVAFNLADNFVEATGQALATFASKENTRAYLRPRLVVQLHSADALDHNGDGQVNLPDAVMVINKVAVGDQSDLAAYDHNGDGQVNLPDAVVIINRVAGN